MATPKIIADFETQLASAIAVSDTSFTLSSATDDDGVALPSGKYYFTIENGSSNKEYLVGTLSGSTVSSVSTVSRQGTETPGAARAHRIGSSVIISDFLTYKNYMDEIALVSAPDADANTKGVVEEATTAEIDADTATGSTGAELFVAPDALATSKYGTRLPSADEKAALAGGGVLGTPSTSNKFLTQDGAKDTDTKFTQRDVFTSSGTFTTPAGVTKIKVKIWGAGSGSPGADDTDVTAAGDQQQPLGTHGNYSEAIVTVTDSQQMTVTIGSGGTGTSGSGLSGGNAAGDSTVVDTATGASVFTMTCKGGQSAREFGAAGTISGSALVSDSSFTIIGGGNAGGVPPVPNSSSAQTGGTGSNAVIVIEY